MIMLRSKNNPSDCNYYAAIKDYNVSVQRQFDHTTYRNIKFQSHILAIVNRDCDVSYTYSCLIGICSRHSAGNKSVISVTTGLGHASPSPVDQHSVTISCFVQDSCYDLFQDVISETNKFIHMNQQYKHTKK